MDTQALSPILSPSEAVNEDFTLDSIKKLATAQSLVSNVFANIGNSCTLSSLEEDLETMKELGIVQKSLLSLTYKTMMKKCSKESLVQWEGSNDENVSIHPPNLQEKKRKIPLSRKDCLDPTHMSSSFKST